MSVYRAADANESLTFRCVVAILGITVYAGRRRSFAYLGRDDGSAKSVEQSRGALLRFVAAPQWLSVVQRPPTQ